VWGWCSVDELGSPMTNYKALTPTLEYEHSRHESTACNTLLNSCFWKPSKQSPEQHGTAKINNYHPTHKCIKIIMSNYYTEQGIKSSDIT
jgi:hypothetical protein